MTSETTIENPPIITVASCMSKVIDSKYVIGITPILMEVTNPLPLI